jgi:uncharacterized membrane protein YdbT with pleckstrin-like domain
VTSVDIPPAVEERLIWTGSPSQWLNFRAFLLSGIAVVLLIAGLSAVSIMGPRALNGLDFPITVVLGLLLVVVLLRAVKNYLDIRFRVYTISSQRIRVTRGILSKRSDGLELYRVDDTLLFEPLLLRIVRKGNIRLVTSDRSNPTVLVEAVPHVRQLWDEIRHCVEECRDRKRTRVVDFEPQSS